MQNKKIKCKVCGKEIEYNENETCDECHIKIIKRLKSKGKTGEKVSIFKIIKNTFVFFVLVIAILSIILNVFLIKDVVEKNGIINENAYKYTDNLLEYEPTLVTEIAQAFINESVQAVEVETNGKNTGNRLDGKKTGIGIYVWNNGNIYEGEFKDDLMHGTGKLYIVEKGTYEGEFVEGKKTGEGTFNFSNGDTYKGAWLNDKMEGEGKYTFANGDTYSGDFSNNMFNGYGTYTKNGQSYSGTWKNNAYNQ